MFIPGQKILCMGMNEDYSDKLEINNVYTFIGYNGRYKSKQWIFIDENNSANCYEIKYFLPFPVKKLTKLIFDIKENV